MSTIKRLSYFLPLAAMLALIAAPVNAQQSTITRPPLTIDRECAATQKAAADIKPVHFMAANGKWSVASDADYKAGMQKKASTAFADAYKEGDRYTWVTLTSFSASGGEHAVQLCFRASDNTLQRARQASSAAELDGPTAQEAYYASDGKLIYKNKAFATTDVLIAKTVESLPFYDVLPK